MNVLIFTALATTSTVCGAIKNLAFESEAMFVMLSVTRATMNTKVTRVTSREGTWGLRLTNLNPLVGYGSQGRR